MPRMRQFRRLSAGLVALATTAGCALWQSPLPSNLGIRRSVAPPALPAPEIPTGPLPAPPTVAAKAPAAGNSSAKPDPLTPPPTPPVPPAELLGRSGPVELADVLASVEQQFPLLLAVQQEYMIAAGQRLAAEGQFDLNVRMRGGNQEGTFGNSRFDMLLEQPTPYWGTSFFSGYRFGYGDFPVYYGDRKTGDGGEFRAGFLIPLAQGGVIDRRRAALRQAQIAENLADPAVRRARLDFVRAAARAYWNWVAAAELYRIAESLFRLASERQEGLETLLQRGGGNEVDVVDGRRTVAERRGAMIAAERRYQQAAFDLSLFIRDANGDPVVLTADRLPKNFLDRQPVPPDLGQLGTDVETALAQRPEITRLQLLKERVTVDLRLAENQRLPGVNVGVAAAQDAGNAKKSFTGTGIFATDTTNAETFMTIEFPAQFREARGRVLAAQAQLAQLLAQERFLRDDITRDVQDTLSNLTQSHQRIQQARQEAAAAAKVLEQEIFRVQGGQSNLFQRNLREIFAAQAQAKVVEALADYYRAAADYRAVLGLEGGPPE